MQIKLFTIPIPDSELAVEEVNKFLEGKHILKIDQQLLKTEEENFLCFCIQYEEEGSHKVAVKKSKPDYFDNPNQEAHHQRFVLISSLRDKIAAEEGELPHRVFTDDELIAFTKFDVPLSEAGMVKQRGVGKLKVEKYGKRLLKMLQEELDKRYE